MGRKSSPNVVSPQLESQMAEQRRQYEASMAQLSAQNTQAATSYQAQLEGLTRMYDGRVSDLSSQIEGQKSYYDQLLGQLNTNLQDTKAQSEAQKQEYERLKKIQDDQVAYLEADRDRSKATQSENSRDLMNSSTTQANNFMQSLDLQRRLRSLRTSTDSQSSNLLR